MRRKLLAAATAAVLALTLTACTSENDDLADLYRDGTNQGFISGDGTVEEFAAGDRGDVIEFTGTSSDGDPITSDDFEGQVLVINFWYALCGPCRVEAPVLESVYQATKDSGATFIGVNIYDGPEQANSFEDTYGISYPSLLARDDDQLKLSFANSTTVRAAPTTLVLDLEGRVAARFVGAIKEESVLRTIVTDLIEEGT